MRHAFRRDWAGWGPLVRVTSSEKVDEASIRAAWGAPAPAIQTARAVKPPEWPYESFGRRGKVVSREVVSQPRYTRLRFANGVTLNFKKTGFESGQVLVRVKFGAGRRELAAQDYQLALLGAAYLKDGGLGKLSLNDLQALTRGMAWDVQLTVDEQAFDLDAASYASGLEGQLAILAAYLSDPGFRGKLNDLIPSDAEAAFRRMRSDPAGVVGEAFTETVAPGGPLARMAPEKAAAVRAGDLERLLKPILTGAPLEVTIVGDVSEAAVVRAMSTTLGALPARRAQPRSRDDTWYMRFPASAVPEVRAVHDGAPDKAAVGVFWPLFVGSPAQRREESALELLSDLFQDRLIDRVREGMGKSYSPEAAVFLPEGGDQGYLYASVETTPADLRAVEAEVKAVAESLRKGGITAAELEAARRPKLAELDADRFDNEWWRDVLADADAPDRMRELLDERGLIAAISLEEIKSAAARWLAPAPISVVAAPRLASQPAIRADVGAAGRR